MTLVSAVLLSAMQETNIVSAGGSLTSAIESQALARLQNLVTSVLGNEAGDRLSIWPVGSAGYRAEDAPSDCVDRTLPGPNNRLMCNLSAASTVYLPPDPYDGARMGVVDVAGNFATCNLTLDGNGRLIEAGTALVLSTDNMTREWFFRADAGDWRKLTALATTDEMPFPAEFDDLFITMLALRMNPRFERTVARETQAFLDRGMAQLRARYRQKKTLSDAELGSLNNRFAGERWWAS